MKIAFLLPSLANRGPISVAQDIVNNIDNEFDDVHVFYFDDIKELSFSAKTTRVSFWDRNFLKGYDVVHSHGLRPDLYLTLFKKNIKSLTTTHNFVFQEYRTNYNWLVGKIVERLWCFSLLRHNKVISLNKSMALYYKKLLKKSSIDIINDGRKACVLNSSVSSEDKNKFYEIKKKYKIIGTSCIITKRKGLHQIIKILPETENYFFVLIGDGKELENLKKLAKQLNVLNKCWFMGFRTNATSYYPFFDIYITSSYSEGFGLSLLEAASLNIPCLCSSIDVHREIFNKDEVCFFELDNKNNLIEALHYLVQNKTNFLMNMKKKYEENYTPEVMAMKYYNQYKYLTEKK